MQDNAKIRTAGKNTKVFRNANTELFTRLWVVSDNSYELKHIANDIEAHGYIIKHWDEFIKFIQANEW